MHSPYEAYSIPSQDSDAGPDDQMAEDESYWERDFSADDEPEVGF